MSLAPRITLIVLCIAAIVGILYWMWVEPYPIGPDPFTPTPHPSPTITDIQLPTI